MKKDSKKIIFIFVLIVMMLLSILFYFKSSFEQSFLTELIRVVIIALIVPFLYGIFRELITYYNTKYDNKILKKVKCHIDKYFKN
jgi:hypothetical protein